MEPSTYLFVTACLNMLAAGWCAMPQDVYISEWERRFELGMCGFFVWNAYLHFMGAIG